jgi:RNA polymerase sigma factor for flagellar operon FliA
MSDVRIPPQQLIFMHQGLVQAIARALHRSFPRYIELEDVIAYGQIGLAQAARDWDASRGTQFSTYAYYRIRGAILEGVHKMIWLHRPPTPATKFQRHSNEVLAQCAEDAQAAPADEASWLSSVGPRLAMVYLLSQVQEEAAGDLEPADGHATPLQSVLDQELKSTLHALIDALPSDERHLIRMAYFEGLSLTETAYRLGISKAWASRLHSRCLDRLARGLRRGQVTE